MKRFILVTVWGWLMLMGWSSSAQQSINVVDFQLTYDASTTRYTAWVVPRYNVPNDNNKGTTEKGGTAQFTVKVPASFTITNVVDIIGSWEKKPLRLGPGNPNQDWSGSGLDPAVNYYVIGKSASQDTYGTFTSGVPVALFTFQGSGCVGPLGALEPGNPFIAQADQRYSLNVANSFYSLSGTPPGGNQPPLEQFRTVTGNPAQCASLAANPDSQTLTAGVTTTIPVLANDFNNGQPASTTNVTVSISTPPASGTATINPDGTISFTPAPGFTGPVSFTYTICDITQPTVCSSAPVSLTVNPVPAVLVANPDSQSLTAGTTTTIPVLANDTYNGLPASATNVTVTVSTPASGTATLNPDGTISFTPAPGFTGPVSFTYTICAITQPTVCSSAPISLTVNPIPAILTANPDAKTLTAGVATTIPVLANDFNNGQPASITSVSVSISTPPTTGTATLNPDGTISFTPAPGFTGPVSFTYTICDLIQTSVCSSAPVSLTVTPMPAVLVANPDAQSLTAGTTTTIPVLANDTYNGLPASATNVTVTVSTPASGTATLNPDGTISFTPAPGFTGPVSFTYTICAITQPTVCSSAPISLTVNPIPAVLTANPDAKTLTAGVATTIPVLANDFNNGQPASITSVSVSISTPPTTGTATLNPDGTISFTPAPGFTGPVSFTYTICDLIQTSVCSSAPVSLTVNPVPAVLVANPDSQSLTAGTTTTIPVLANDTYNGLPASATNVTVTVSTPASGTATVNPDGTISFTPAPGFTGPVSFTYTICAITQPTVCSSAPVSLTVGSAPTQSADLLITKKVSQASSAVGDVVSFTITVQNMGPGSALGVFVTDTLLRNSSVQLQGAATPSKGLFNAVTGLWTIGDLAVNETATFVLSVRVIAEGVVVNVASVTATGSQDPNTTNNQASACTSVPYILCSGESLTISVPRDYVDVRWYRNNDPTPVKTGNSVVLDLPGTYTVSSSNGTCPIAGCCPIIIQQGDCCPADQCVPFVIRKTKSRL